MSDIIQILPDSVANQIAAGEVIQRPASVVKELMENAVDAGASSIILRVKDAGKTYVQVIDNGRGMSPTDAARCFERHATSKISQATDLFAIRTMGFRGEALASIASIAEVSLKTKPQKAELGIHIRMSGSKLESQMEEAMSSGTNITVRNLFFNVPARRKFLKSEQTELRHIITEFNHLALAYPDMEFQLFHNNTQVFNLPSGNFKQRIAGIFGKNIQHNLIPIQTETSIVKLEGFIGKPEYARKTYGEQFFFVNNRYMKHPFFHKAITKAYEQLIPQDHYPGYFINFQADPATIDINIHPTKTEIKFEDERAIWQILLASAKEAIGKHNLAPTLDFSKEGVIDIPVSRKETEVSHPTENYDPTFNPFEEERKYGGSGKSGTGNGGGGNSGGGNSGGGAGYQSDRTSAVSQWEQLFERKSNTDLSPGLGFGGEVNEPAVGENKYLQLKNRYIITPVKSGLMLIDQRRAHQRILFEQFMETLEKGSNPAQESLFPVTIELNPTDHQLLLEYAGEIEKLGFDLRDFGQNSLVVHGIPANSSTHDIASVLESLLQQIKELGSEPSLNAHQKVARSSAIASSIPYGKTLTGREMQELVDQLFACGNPNISPGGKPVLFIVKLEELEKHLA